jgi:ElaB/YqjD/DUF883 family membrane-anchored ribosome-binding protein
MQAQDRTKEAPGGDPSRQAAMEANAEFEAALLRLATEIIALRRDVIQIVDRMGRLGEAGSEAARATLRAAAHDAPDLRDRVAREIGGEMSGLRDDLLRTAREHPWRTLGLAAIAGAVLGLMLRR